MDLPDDIFNELTDAAAPLPQTPEAELRTVPRLQMSMVVTLIRLNAKNAKPMIATIRDLSTRGVGLEFSEPIHTNDPFAIRLPRSKGQPLWIQCLATRWSPIDGTLFSIGAKFVGTFAFAKTTDAAAPPTVAVSKAG